MKKHKKGAQSAKKADTKEEKDEEDVKVFKQEELVKQVKNQTGTPTSVPPLTTAPVQTPPVQLPTVNQVPPTFSPYDYFGVAPPPQRQQPQQPQPQNTSNTNFLQTLAGFLATPAGAELIKWFRENFGKKEDPISETAYQQMFDSWTSMYQLAKATLANLAMGGTKSYAKGLQKYYEEYYKRKAANDSEKMIKAEEEEEENPFKILIDKLNQIDSKVSKHDEELTRLKKRVAKKKKKARKAEEVRPQEMTETQQEETTAEQQQTQSTGQPGIFINEEEQNKEQGGVFLQ